VPGTDELASILSAIGGPLLPWAGHEERIVEEIVLRLSLSADPADAVGLMSTLDWARGVHCSHLVTLEVDDVPHDWRA
jgi:hypothetical protein